LSQFDEMKNKGSPST